MLLGSLLGFLYSSVPELLTLYKDSKDKKHELSVLEKQIEFEKISVNKNNQEIIKNCCFDKFNANVSSVKSGCGLNFIDILRGSVRPIITYMFFILFAFIKVLSVVQAYHVGYTALESINKAWDGDSQALFAAIISFWFGSRAISKLNVGSSRS